MTKKQNSVQEPDVQFEWPQYKNDRERIKLWSERFTNSSISEAFSEIYGITVDSVNDIANILPQEVSLGDDIKLSILGNRIDAGNIKENIEVRNNLSKYAKFKNATQPIEMLGRVVKHNNKQTIVDVIEPLYDEWVSLNTKNYIHQFDVADDKSLIARGLHLTKGGYKCQVDATSISHILGEEYVVDAFIPGSQIVLNIERNFEKWEGKSVRVFVTNYIPHPTKPGKMMAICSAKKYLEHIGNMHIIKLFKEWTEGSEFWKDFSKDKLDGIVTGVLNSSKKCGVFVEIPLYNITGMILMSPQDIVKYAPQQQIRVSLVGFETPTYYNEAVEQIQHNNPYEFDGDILMKCSLKPVLKL